MPAFWAAVGFSAGIILADNFGWFSLLSATLGLFYLRWRRLGLLLLFVPLGALAYMLSLARLPDDISDIRNTNALLVAEALDTERIRILGFDEDGFARASGTLRYDGMWLPVRKPYFLAGHIDSAGTFRIAKAVALERYPVFSGARAWARGVLMRASSSPENFGLSLGFLLGERDRIPKPLLDDFRSTGLMHLLALSGLHVGLIFLILTVGLSFLSKRWGASIAAGLVWIYAFFVGASPSVIRAAIFVSLFTLAYISGRKRSDLNTLGAAALATLLVNPSWIADIGFQLSYLATFGILYYMRGVWLSGSWFRKWVISPILVTLSAQVFVAPVLLSEFGALSLWAFPLNIACVPLLGLVMSEWALYFLFYPLKIAAPFAAVANLGLDLLRLIITSAVSLSRLQLRFSMPLWAMALWWAIAILGRPGVFWLRARFSRRNT
ncbi:MAG: ComEC/Rec2 family competence protein [candidate division WOR-3 bacterium]